MVGRVKYAPGSIASFIACILFILLVNIFTIGSIFLLVLFFFLYSFVAINNSYDEFKADDPQEIVVDEAGAGPMNAKRARGTELEGKGEEPDWSQDFADSNYVMNT